MEKNSVYGDNSFDSVCFDIFNLAAKCILAHGNKVLSYSDFKQKLKEDYNVSRKKQVEGSGAILLQQLLILEYGYKQCEKGHNIEMAINNFKNLKA